MSRPSHRPSVRPTRLLLVLALAVPLFPSGRLTAQSSSSSGQSSSSQSSSGQSSSGQSSSSQGGQKPDQADSSSSGRSLPRRPQVEAGGSAVTLETSEPLFDIAVALNACGYDDGLDRSDPVRARIRTDVNDSAQATPDAKAGTAALCDYVHKHTLADGGLNLAQYVSLALFLTPDLKLTVDETDLPPDSTQVVNILSPLRTFVEADHIHALWVKYRPEYEALVDNVHDPLTRVILNTNIYLKLPASSYDGRRFLVLLEPMLAPTATNARIYSNDFIVVTSPGNDPKALVKMDQIRHTYLHFEIEPLVYSRASSMDRMVPLLKTVQEAPIDPIYKADIISLITECMIKAVEAHTMDFGIAVPAKPSAAKRTDRVEQERYTAEMTIYERQNEADRRNLVDLDMRHGWVLTGYFYDRLGEMEREGSSLKDDMGQIVYGMDIERERQHDAHIAFLPEETHDVVHRRPRRLTGLDLAELKLAKGDRDGAKQIAQQVLAGPAANPAADAATQARANYLIARINLLEQDPDDAISHFRAALDISKDPRTLAWCHIYLGRLYDMQQDPDRKRAVAEYRLALNLRDDLPDTKAAAESGLHAPFAPPKHDAAVPTDPDTDDNAPIDPTGKAEKDSYKPTPQQ